MLGACFPITADLKYYLKDLNDARARIAAVPPSDDAPFIIRQETQALEETERMIPDAVTRLGAAVEQLDLFLTARASEVAEFKASSPEAAATLEQVLQQLATARELV
ncbi:tubulin binding cofactor A [Fonticula alba]|uniref:Tubulin-specific chaperone A n=1 Tax=Fonticula alba TaxID=691883 RepID=A0A058ZGD3_FONAL|nr:tubulin binding cofactor A [Fonticula alba]KCV72542.1 tubulin binding cofactor A [Fonticula alba]|eukprot:XP_009492243.1 tubulin binding cofactor A [Fonticula alba]